MRLGKYLALGGVSSRRGSEELIKAGEVTVNGRVVRDPAFSIGPNDSVEIGGEPVRLVPEHPNAYVMVNKPVGVLSTLKPGREKEPCLSDLFQFEERLHPVGRLDRDTSGLLLMTNDGDLTLRLTHPRHEIEKEYLAKLNRALRPGEVRRIERGVVIDERPVNVREMGLAAGGRIRIVITEGRNRIIRRLFGALGLNVLELKRVRIGPLGLGHLAIGKWRKLTSAEINKLKSGINDEHSISPSLGNKPRPRRSASTG